MIFCVSNKRSEIRHFRLAGFLLLRSYLDLFFYQLRNFHFSAKEKHVTSRVYRLVSRVLFKTEILISTVTHTNRNTDLGLITASFREIAYVEIQFIQQLQQTNEFRYFYCWSYSIMGARSRTTNTAVIKKSQLQRGIHTHTHTQRRNELIL